MGEKKWNWVMRLTKFQTTSSVWQVETKYKSARTTFSLLGGGYFLFFFYFYFYKTSKNTDSTRRYTTQLTCSRPAGQIAVLSAWWLAIWVKDRRLPLLGKHVRRIRRQHLSHRPACSGVYTEIDAVPSSFRHVSHDLGDRAREWDSGSMVQLEISRKLGRF